MELTLVTRLPYLHGALERSHSYKDKIARGITPVWALFSYPVLLAADILLYRRTWYPWEGPETACGNYARHSGAVQRNLWRDLRASEPLIADEIALIPGVDGQKMYKSLRERHFIFETEKELKKKGCAS
jgi:tryptophanyl-tRNA synthetase